MPYNYKNYVHLEGIVDQDALITTTPEGEVVKFTVAIRESYRDPQGATIRRVDLIHVEVGPKATKFVTTLKKGTPVMIDARIELQSLLHRLPPQGAEYNVITVRAHRIHSVDYSGWKRTPQEIANSTSYEES